ncbi:MAG: hypothetical protein V1790_10005 [Planctomycetota bacterium]
MATTTFPGFPRIESIVASSVAADKNGIQRPPASAPTPPPSTAPCGPPSPPTPFSRAATLACTSNPSGFPRSFDPSYPCTLSCLITRVAGADPIYHTTDWQIVANHLHAAHAPVDLTFDYQWIVTLPWPINDPHLITFDNGLAHTFDEDAFDEDDVLGIRIARVPSEPDDRYERSINIPAVVQLTYTSRCPLLSCL